ncbi:MAG: response regulator [Treponema sp.]|nr:response regulator [Treponema sp.]
MENKKKILIIDDEKMNIMALAHFLRPKYDIIVAIDGASGLEVAQKQIPDIILLDIIMPHMSGYEVIQKFKESEVTRSIPVIFISGLNDSGDEAKGLEFGAVDYIIKPFDKTVVNTKIKLHLKISAYERAIEDLCKIIGISAPANDEFDSIDEFISGIKNKI